MSRSEVIKILKEFKYKHSDKYGILVIGLFGSVARDEVAKESDVDVVIKMEKQYLFKMIGIKQDLEEILHVPVDIISYREKMNPFLKKRIDKEAIYV